MVTSPTSVQHQSSIYAGAGAEPAMKFPHVIGTFPLGSWGGGRQPDKTPALCLTPSVLYGVSAAALHFVSLFSRHGPIPPLSIFHFFANKALRRIDPK
jgi:hypothetical protein